LFFFQPDIFFLELLAEPGLIVTRGTDASDENQSENSTDEEGTH